MKMTRRAVLGTAASLAGTALGLTDARAGAEAPRVHLRLAETSDLHMFVLDWDYFHAKPDPTVGLAKTASLIRAARAENPNTLLFDNGDFLQGNPLADYIVKKPAPNATALHPLVTVMAGLGYDAVGLGNHEFNYGLEFLEATFQGAPFPFLCANAKRAGGGAFLPPYAILKRNVKDTAGALHELRIGVISFLPPQIMVWDKTRLEGKIEAQDIVVTARRYLPELRAACDVTVALCHAGINTGPWAEGEENAAFHLSQVPGIDAIMMGHSHRVFPGKDYAGLEGVDALAGRLNGVPAVMPGFWGSHLGIVDLTLKREAARWTVEAAKSEARPIYRRDQGGVTELAASDLAVTAAIAPAHQATLGWVEQPIGAIDAPLHSYLVWAGYDPATAFVNAAQTWYARPLLVSAGFADLPLLAAASPYRAGYTPDGFIDIPPGPVALRQAADLYIYSNNTVAVVKVTGAQIVEWLEYAARVFNVIDPSAPMPQALVNKRLPSYTFDIIAGLSYTIDVTQPAWSGTAGNTGAKGRIADVRFKGKHIELNREFAVVTNSFRADGGGHFPALAGANIILRAPDSNRDAVQRYFQAHRTVTVSNTSPWRFANTGRPAAVYFDTGNAAPAHLRDLSTLALLGEGEPGYLRVGMTLP